MAFMATHVLHGTLKRNHGKIDVHGYLTDKRSGANAKEWTAGYAPETMRFAHMGLAGMVAETLQLPPVVFLRSDMTADETNN